jgi:hypothetical protein
MTRTKPCQNWLCFLPPGRGRARNNNNWPRNGSKAGRLKLEAARLELGKLEGKLLETEAARRVFSDLVIYFRQRLMHLPGAVKTTLKLDNRQTIGLQKEIRAALTELRDQGKRAPNGEAATGKRAPQRRRRSKQPRG